MKPSKLRFFIFWIFICFCLSAQGQTLLVTDVEPVGRYVPNSPEEYIITLSDVPEGCRGSWDVDLVTESNYLGFTGELQEGLDLVVDANTGTGTITTTFSTPLSGIIYVTVTASKIGCGTEIDSRILNPLELTTTSCDAAFLEDFESVANNTGLTKANDNTKVVGQGTAFRNNATIGGNNYFRVQNNNSGEMSKKLVARGLGGEEVHWVSNDISVSDCCSRTISVDIFGEEGEATGDQPDYVRAYYTLNGGPEVLFAEGLGSFAKTDTISTCQIPGITESATLNIVVRVRNNAEDEYHGFDNVNVKEGNLIAAPQITGVNCIGNGNVGESLIILAANATIGCSLNFECEDCGGLQANNEFTVAADAEYTINITNENYPDCGSVSSTVRVFADGTCEFLLPIALVDFYGRAEADAIGVYWTTALELNNAYMAVERSVNGIDFEEIGQVPGQGTTDEMQSYTFIDNYPVPGVNYYRLRQVDFDGAFEYHPVISVLFDRPLTFSLQASPNPVSDFLQVEWSLPNAEDGQIRVFDAQGRMMSKRAIGQGSGRYNLPVSNLTGGIYLLQLVQGGKTDWLRFVKK